MIIFQELKLSYIILARAETNITCKSLKKMSDKIDRREFIRMISALGLSAAAVFRPYHRGTGQVPRRRACICRRCFPGLHGKRRDHGRPPEKSAGTSWEHIPVCKKGMWVVLKPNIAWARKPEQAATTTPELMYCLVKACYGADAGKVTYTNILRIKYFRIQGKRHPESCGKRRGAHKIRVTEAHFTRKSRYRRVKT